MTALLEVRDLHVFYGESQALNGLSFGVEEGSITSLVGNNGAGKTTTLKALTGLQPVRSGEIWFKGQRIDNLPSYVIVSRGIALSPEGRRVFPHMSVHENLLVGAHLQTSTAAAQDLERIFGIFPRLKERRRQRAGSLSGGEQQMLAIGRALMARPKLLLLDEPSLGLAPLVVAEICAVIRQIASDGISCILVEQNAAVALSVSSYGYVIEHGAVVSQGAPDMLLSSDLLRNAYLGGAQATSVFAPPSEGTH